MPVIRMVLDTFELTGKQEILDELNKALGGAQQTLQQQQAMEQQQALAQSAQAEAGALAQVQQAVAPPETAQGARADLELDRAIS